MNVLFFCIQWKRMGGNSMVNMVLGNRERDGEKQRERKTHRGKNLTISYLL